MRPKLMSWKDVSKYIYYSDVLIVDLRDSGEYKKGHIRGAWNIPYEELEGRMKQLRGYKRAITETRAWRRPERWRRTAGRQLRW